MKQPDVEGAEHYAFRQLQQNLSPKLSYHSLAHTFSDVVPATRRLAHLAGIYGEDFFLLHTAACFHDIGFVEQRVEHEAVGARIASEVLPTFGFNAKQITCIVNMIMATRLPQTPSTILEKIIADADLDVLGRDDFLERNQALRNEIAAFGNAVPDEQWYQEQLAFLCKHTYFTSVARNLRGLAKQDNIIALRAKLESRQQQIK